MIVSFDNVNIGIREHCLLTGVQFTVSEGEFVYVVGRVGSGKSSLLKTLYAEYPPQGTGTAEILDEDLYHLKRKKVSALRRRLGIVFQDFQLLPDKTAAQNIDFVLRATGWKDKKERATRIQEVLALVGMSDKADCFPHQMSGGEQQCVAIARALVNRPEILLADEPTGNLDATNSTNIMRILRHVADGGTPVVMVTHNLRLLREFPGIVYECRDGQMHLLSEDEALIGTSAKGEGDGDEGFSFVPEAEAGTAARPSEPKEEGKEPEVEAAQPEEVAVSSPEVAVPSPEVAPESASETAPEPAENEGYSIAPEADDDGK